MSKIISDTIQGRSKDPNVNAGLTIAGVTTATGVINASSDVRITGNLNAGIVTVTSISGNGAGLSNVGVDTATVDASTLQVSGISTFKNELKVTTGGIEVDGGGLDVAGVGTFAGVVNASSDVRVTGNLNAGIVTATNFIPSAGQLSHKNLIINGDCRIAQRGTTSGTGGLTTIDRWRGAVGSGLGNSFTGSQESVSSSDTGPWEEGFRKYFRITQSGAGSANAAGALENQYRIEAQDIANSGWNYLSSTSYMTISFWLRVSTNQTFYGYVYSYDGTPQAYAYSFTASANNTWTKITHTFPGNTNLTFDDNNNAGMQLLFIPYYGTNYTNDKTLNTWAAHSGSNYVPDMASTWLTAGASTFDMTGLQLEVGSVATPFEHRSFNDELIRCQRYLFKNINEAGELGANYAKAYNNNELFASVRFPTAMRATPTVTAYSNSGTSGQVHKLGSPDTAYTSIDRLDKYGGMRFNSSGAWGTGDTDMYSFTFQAESEI